MAKASLGGGCPSASRPPRAGRGARTHKSLPRKCRHASLSKRMPASPAEWGQEGAQQPLTHTATAGDCVAAPEAHPTTTTTKAYERGAQPSHTAPRPQRMGRTAPSSQRWVGGWELGGQVGGLAGAGVGWAVAATAGAQPPGPPPPPPQPRKPSSVFDTNGLMKSKHGDGRGPHPQQRLPKPKPIRTITQSPAHERRPHKTTPQNNHPATPYCMHQLPAVGAQQPAESVYCCHGKGGGRQCTHAATLRRARLRPALGASAHPVPPWHPGSGVPTPTRSNTAAALPRPRAHPRLMRSRTAAPPPRARPTPAATTPPARRRRRPTPGSRSRRRPARARCWCAAPGARCWRSAAAAPSGG